MRIDIFKNKCLWNFLAQFNTVIQKRWEKCIEKRGSTYVWKNGEVLSEGVAVWFNPATVSQIPFPRNYPNLIPLNYDLKFIVNENRCCYLGIFLINLLYQDKQDILIEDRCCGMAKFSFLLAQLGFNNFNLIDNFSQIDSACIDKMMEGIPFKVNRNEEPVVINQSGYPCVLEDRPIGNAELICLYNNEHLIDWANKNLTFLCEDSDLLSKAYCRPDKLGEFQNKIRKYEVKQ